MSRLGAVRREIVGFFVDDAFLGVATVLVVVAAALCRELLTGRPLVAGVVLAGGCLMALALSLARAASLSRKAERSRADGDAEGRDLVGANNAS
jgi:hypothetical protein